MAIWKSEYTVSDFWWHFSLACDTDLACFTWYWRNMMVPVLKGKMCYPAQHELLVSFSIAITSVWQREKNGVCDSSYSVRASEGSWPVEPVWVMDENNYLKHPLAWWVRDSEEVPCRVSMGLRLVFMWYNNSNDCLFISVPQYFITQLLHSYSPILYPFTGGGALAPELPEALIRCTSTTTPACKAEKQ